MNSLAERAIRLVLWAYPAEFRREFGPEMLQVARDRCRFERRSAWRVVVSEACDAVRAAPSIRWEYAMHRIVMLAILGGFAVTAVLVTKLALIPLLAVAILAAWLWARNRRPIAPAVAERRWAAVLAGGIVGIGIAIAIPAIDGDELSGFWWTVMAVAGVAGTIAVIRSWRTGDEQSSPPDRRHHAVLSHRRVSRFSSVPCSRAIGGPVEDDWHCGLSRNDRGRRYPEVPRLAGSTALPNDVESSSVPVAHDGGARSGSPAARREVLVVDGTSTRIVDSARGPGRPIAGRMRCRSAYTYA